MTHTAGLSQSINQGGHFPENTPTRASSIITALLSFSFLAVLLFAVSGCQAEATVTLGSKTWSVESAITPEERYQGLSGRMELPEGSGMLFIFDEDQHLSFWMFRMNFPLDIVWIDSACRVIDVTLKAEVPAPGQSPYDLPRYAPQSPARFVLEINAGEFEAADLRVGDIAVFGGDVAGLHGC